MLLTGKLRALLRLILDAGPCKQLHNSACPSLPEGGNPAGRGSLQRVSILHSGMLWLPMGRWTLLWLAWYPGLHIPVT